MSPGQPIIALQGVRKSFGDEVVLAGIDLTIHAGQTTVVIGPSGCGKSVLIKHMIGLLRPDSGQVFFDGREISNLSEKKLHPFRQRMGFLFQGGALFDSMSVEKNICFPLAEHGSGSAGEHRERCREVLRLVGLDGLQDRFPAELSGGAAEAGRAGPGDRAGPGSDLLRRTDDGAGPHPRGFD